MADSWLQLVEEFGVLDLLKVVDVRLLSVFFDAVVEIFAEVLGPGFF